MSILFRDLVLNEVKFYTGKILYCYSYLMYLYWIKSVKIDSITNTMVHMIDYEFTMILMESTRDHHSWDLSLMKLRF